MITILSDNGRFKAELDDTEDGIAIVFWHRMTGDEPLWKLICRQTLDVTFHVVLDLAHDAINELVVPPSSFPTPAQQRRRVLSIIS
jgi:hypothetical protein